MLKEKNWEARGEKSGCSRRKIGMLEEGNGMLEERNWDARGSNEGFSLLLAPEERGRRQENPEILDIFGDDGA